MKRITKLSFVVAALLGLSAVATAQQPQVAAAADPAATVAAIAPPSNLTVQPAPAQLPKLAGKYEGRWTLDERGRQIGNTLALIVDAQSGDGRIQGRYTYWAATGARGNCVSMDEAPAMGIWDGKTLRLTVTPKDSYCPSVEVLFVAGEGGRFDRPQRPDRTAWLLPVK